MAKIRIVKIPAGEAPLLIRGEWVGLELPFVDIENIRQGILSKKVEEGLYYVVESKTAIEILRRKCPEAANWWEKNRKTIIGKTIIGPYLLFRRDECMLL